MASAELVEVRGGWSVFSAERGKRGAYWSPDIAFWASGRARSRGLNTVMPRAAAENVLAHLQKQRDLTRIYPETLQLESAGDESRLAGK